MPILCKARALMRPSGLSRTGTGDFNRKEWREGVPAHPGESRGRAGAERWGSGSILAASGIAPAAEDTILPTADSAHRYFSEHNPDLTSGCPRGEAGFGMPLLPFGSR
jgi:hypothetical protein